ncbi:hypothetical protein K6U20_03490 [Vibrio fluvialis]|uniref:hypothetical protein n=1 Tax=Vibrio fluvialis TaxID=676 RepID=UPI001EEA6793|nr:hypothetical protein [Vibrio fluvialis]MCG6403695.1 hypothetical protein [Vibrio fluvialis]
MSKNSLHPISASEIFKLKAEQFSFLITKLSGLTKIPSKKRYDWLCLALGYKDHSDLLHSNYLRRTVNKSNVLTIFSDKKQREKIISIFSSNLPTVSKSHICKAANFMAIIEKPEYKNLLLPLINSGIRISIISTLVKPKNNLEQYKNKYKIKTNNLNIKQSSHSMSALRQSFLRNMLDNMK